MDGICDCSWLLFGWVTFPSVLTWNRTHTLFVGQIRWFISHIWRKSVSAPYFWAKMSQELAPLFAFGSWEPKPKFGRLSIDLTSQLHKGGWAPLPILEEKSRELTPFFVFGSRRPNLAGFPSLISHLRNAPLITFYLSFPGEISVLIWGGCYSSWSKRKPRTFQILFDTLCPL